MGIPLAEGIPLIGKAGRVYAYLENRLSTHASTVIESNDNKDRHIDPQVERHIVVRYTKLILVSLLRRFFQKIFSNGR